ncbi:MAG TPA: PEP-CTERM sorting domain-containing protein, partial [Chthoniobacteraceae bacterium]
LLTLSLNHTITSTFQTFTSSLNNWNLNEGSLASLKENVGSLNFISLNIGYNSNGALDAFGRDADNAISVDNFAVAAVPEPGTASLCLLTLGGLLARRRR